MNDACCSRPPISSSYEAVGKYETLKDGMKVYVTGPANAERAVIYIYDILGYSQQQLLGADLLSAELNARVFLPDLLRGKNLGPDAFAPDKVQATMASLGAFMGPGGPGDLVAAAGSLPTLKAELKAQYASKAAKWAAVGFCWGGKVVAIATADKGEVPFNVSGACHPGKIDPEEAKAFPIPHICLLSGEDGSPEEQKAYHKALGENGQDVVFEVFGDQVHGWMAARGDLSGGKTKAEFERGYDLVAKFFDKHL